MCVKIFAGEPLDKAAASRIPWRLSITSPLAVGCFMHRLLVLPMALLSFFLSGCGKESANSSRLFDAGMILSSSMEEISHDFFVKNTTNQVVRVLNVEKTCSCTSYAIGDSQLAPGQITKLTLSAKVPQTFFKLSVGCILKTDHPTFNNLDYTLNFTSVPSVALSSDHVSMGEHLMGDVVPMAASLVVTAHGDSPTALRQDQLRFPDDLLVELEPPRSQKRISDRFWKVEQLLHITVGAKHDRSVGFHTSPIELQTSRGEQFTIPVSWRYTSPISISPGYLEFGDVEPGVVSRTQHITLRNSRSQPYSIRTALSKGPHAKALAINFRQEADVSHVLDFHLGLPADAIPGSISGVVVIQTSDASQGIFTVPWSANVVPGSSVHSMPESNPTTTSTRTH